MNSVPTNNMDVKKQNRINTLRCLLKYDRISQPELAQKLNLSWPTVLQNVKELINLGLVHEVGAYKSTGGRKAKAYASIPDAKLAIALKQFDQKETDKNYIFEIPMGSHFRIHNGKIFKKIALRVKRYECLEISSGRLYLFQPNAEVELLPN